MTMYTWTLSYKKSLMGPLKVFREQLEDRGQRHLKEILRLEQESEWGLRGRSRQRQSKTVSNRDCHGHL